MIDVIFTDIDQALRVLDGNSVTVTVLDGEEFSGVLSYFPADNKVSLWDGGLSEYEAPCDEIEKITVL